MYFKVHVLPLQTLYTYPESFRAAKILIAAQYSGVSVRVVSEPPEFVLGETNKMQEFLSKFPLGKVRHSPVCLSLLDTALFQLLATLFKMHI